MQVLGYGYYISSLRQSHHFVVSWFLELELNWYLLLRSHHKGVVTLGWLLPFGPWVFVITMSQFACSNVIQCNFPRKNRELWIRDRCTKGCINFPKLHLFLHHSVERSLWSWARIDTACIGSIIRAGLAGDSWHSSKIIHADEKNTGTI